MAITTGMSNSNGMHCVQFNDNGNILFNVYMASSKLTKVS